MVAAIAVMLRQGGTASDRETGAYSGSPGSNWFSQSKVKPRYSR
jgi:hypothetical protein